MTTKADKKNAPRWLISEIATGLQRLMLLSLQDRPASETIEGTARAWADAFWHSHHHWDKALDAARIAKAFVIVSARAERFPSPKVVMDAMPRRVERLKLAPPPMSDEKRQENLRRLAHIRLKFKMRSGRRS